MEHEYIDSKTTYEFKPVTLTLCMSMLRTLG